MAIEETHQDPDPQTELTALRLRVAELESALGRMNESERVLRASLESPKGVNILALDTDYRYIYFNNSHRDVMKLAYGADIAVGMRILDCITFEPDRLKTRRLYDLVRSGTSQSTIERFGPDGASSYQTHINPMLDEHGVVFGIMAYAIDVTAQLRSERELAESNVIYQGLLATTTDGYLLVDDAGYIQDVNDAYCRMSGYSRAELLTMRIPDLEVEETPEDTAAHIRRMIEDGGDLFETRHRRRDGTVWNVEASVTWHAAWQGRFVAFHRDITARKQAEAAVQLSEERFRGMFENAPDAILLISLDGHVRDLNPAASVVYGYDHDEFVGKHGSEFVHPDYVWIFGDALATTLAGRIFSAESVDVRKDGTAFPIEVHIAPFSHLGEPVMLCFIRDITARRQAEESLKQHSERLQNVISATHAGIWEWNIQQMTHVVNEAWAEMFGYTLAELQPTTDELMRTLFHPEDRDRVSATLRAHLRGELPFYSCEARVKHKDGHWVWTLGSGKVLKWDEKGTPLVFYGILIDVSERRAEEDIRRKLDEQGATIHKLESLGHLAGGIAHDFNNLLSGVYGYVDLAKATSSEPLVRDHLTHALASMERTRALTRQLLTFATGGAPVKGKGPFFPFVQDTVEFGLRGSKTACRFQVADDLWWGDFDRNQLGQVIDNLVKNAEQAMPEGGIIEVSATNLTLGNAEQRALAPGHYVQLSFSDTGTGISAEDLKSIFNPFFTTRSGGHGLGLATCHSIIKRHGGSIEVESELGRGTTFRVCLPAIVREGQETGGASRPNTYAGSGEILVMDDEPVVRETIRLVLAHLGFTVTTCSNGREAIDCFDQALREGRHWIAIFLDLTIPGGMGGVAVAAELRRLNPVVPIFVVSGYAEDPVLATPERYGFSGSIQKPFTAAELAALLEKHLPRAG